MLIVTFILCISVALFVLAIFKISLVFTNAKKYVEMLKSYRNCSYKGKNMMHDS